MIDRLGRLGQRFTVLLSGEAIQSAFNFGLNVALARVLTPACYGAFAIVVLIAGFAIIYMRALINVPAIAVAPHGGSLNRNRSSAVTFGSGAVGVAMVSTVVAAAILAVWEPRSALAGGLFVGCWALRSYVRMALSTQGSMGKAAGSDLGFAISAAVLCVPLVYFDPKHLLQYVFLALAAAHLIGSLIAVTQQGGRIRISFRRSVRRRLARLLPTMTWSIISVTASNIQGQGGIFLLAVLAGPAAYAPIAITMSFFTPLRLATSSVMYMMLPDLAENVARPGSRGFADLFIAPMCLILLICGLYGVVMVLGFPTLARDAFAGRFSGEPLDLIAVLNWCISTTAVLYAVPKLQLETARKFKLTTGLAIVSGAVGLPLVALLLSVTTPAWSLCGILVSELMILTGCLVFSYRDTRPRPVSARLVASEGPQLDTLSLDQALSRRR